MEWAGTVLKPEVFCPEDYAILRAGGDRVIAEGFKVAPEEVARRFSTEREPWNFSFGFHGIYTDISRWMQLGPKHLTDRVRRELGYKLMIGG